MSARGLHGWLRPIDGGVGRRPGSSRTGGAGRHLGSAGTGCLRSVQVRHGLTALPVLPEAPVLLRSRPRHSVCAAEGDQRNLCHRRGRVRSAEPVADRAVR